jgi:hypothetical protein
MKLEHNYLKTRGPYNPTQLRNSVHGSSFVQFLQDQKPQRFSLFKKQLMALLIVFACLFLLAFEFGIATWVYELFR